MSSHQDLKVRKGQKLVNYVRFEKLKQHLTFKNINAEQRALIEKAAVESYIFNMSDCEFEEALASPDDGEGLKGK